MLICSKNSIDKLKFDEIANLMTGCMTNMLIINAYYSLD